MSEARQIPDPEDNWSEVELWRWQYGSLPEPGDSRPLDVSAGLGGMADGIERGDFPSPFNVVSVLRYAAKQIKNRNAHDDLLAACKAFIAWCDNEDGYQPRVQVENIARAAIQKAKTHDE